MAEEKLTAPIETNNIELNRDANTIFELINRAEQFGDHKIDLMAVNGDFWFCGKDIATILGYKNQQKAIRDHVRHKHKISLDDLCNKNEVNAAFTFKGNQKDTLYINEAGLYQLIMKSKLEIAEKFQDWVTDDLLPKIRKVGQDKYLKQLEESKQQLQIKDDLLKEKDGQLNRLHNIQVELLSYKKRESKDETIYIVSTANYARQGIFKIGRTKNAMKFRSSGHNVTHIKGDKVASLIEFKVNDCVLVEKNIHTKLRGLALEGETEFFMCPYNLLRALVDLIVRNDDRENEVVNSVIDTVYALKRQVFTPADWTLEVDMKIFDVNMRLVADDEKEIVRFNVTTATADQKQEFVRECLEAYKRTIAPPVTTENTQPQTTQIVWKTFQGFLLERLAIPKSQFKSGLWRPLVKAEEGDKNNLAIKWR